MIMVIFDTQYYQKDFLLTTSMFIVLKFLTFHIVLTSRLFLSNAHCQSIDLEKVQMQCFSSHNRIFHSCKMFFFFFF